MRSVQQQRLDDLAKSSPGEGDRPKEKKQRTMPGYFDRTSSGCAPHDSVETRNSPAHNTRGKVKPLPSPEDVLTGDRDGTEMAKILISPISYGRTMMRQREPPRAKTE